MSLGHTEPITQKHTLQKHPREESSGLDLKAFRFQEVLQTAGHFSKNWLESRHWGWHEATRLAPSWCRERGGRSKGRVLETNSACAPASSPPTPAFAHSLGTKLKHLQLFEPFSSHQSLLHPPAGWKSRGGILLDQYQTGVRGERVELSHPSDSGSTPLAQRPPGGWSSSCLQR